MIVGFDCGGTGTTAVAIENGEVVATVSGSAGNLKRIGYEEAVKLIVSLTTELRRKAAFPITGYGVGIAGAGKPEERAQLKALLDEVVRAPVVVDTDAAAALNGAFDGGPGLLLIAGTGSIAYGKAGVHAEPLRVGGWGWQIGDEGSGCWLGREAIRCAMLGYDGRGEPTELSDEIVRFLDLKSILDCIPMIYSSEWTAARYGELAPMVLEVAKTDPVALRLVRLAASHLARHLVVLQERLSSSAVVSEAAFSGGLIANDTMLRSELVAELEHIGTIRIVEAKYPPAVGAAKMLEN